MTRPQPKPLRAITEPRLIDLQEEASALGVEIVTDVSAVKPENEPVFLAYQARWFEDDSPICIAEKSRRTGLTWAEAGRDVIVAAKPRRRGGRNVFYVGSRQEMALEYIAACALFARAFNQLAQADVYEQTFWDDEKKEEILTYMIRFPKSGLKVQALSSRPSNLRGLQGDVVIDEAAFHEALDELLKAALALVMWGAHVRIISSHNGVENLFNQYIQDARAGRKDYSVHRITLDDAIADGLYRRICYVTGQEWSPEVEKKWRDDLYKNAPNKESAEEEYGCIPKASGGAYIPRVLLDRAARPEHVVVRFTAPDGWLEWTEAERQRTALTFCEETLLPILQQLNPARRHAYGQDFARRGDLSIGAFGSIEQDTRRCLRCLVEMKNVTYAQQREIVFYILARLPRLCGAAFDETGNGGYLAEAVLLRYGSTMVDCISLNDGWYREWMPKYKALYEDGMIEIPQDEDTITDQRHIQVIKGVPKIDKSRTEGADGAQRHGDSAVAGVMFVRASYMDGSAIEFEAIPGRHSDQSHDDDGDYHDNDNSGGCW
ncbi:TPA: hypothetical protein ACXPD2_000152 [Klebsiella pneumoniae]|uniref:hypothetical protein n=1 Tax=Klebsiella pneumoniae TaxID=573 RepID=UPI0016442E6A|nr:hypothetical protein [Klebsiella pneumoniae]EKW2891634.1 hypothetical protein [Klebsiella pneumoniae]ELA0627893.1 hypothetical protein [Klebsiella pneumoniae]MBC4125401.1 hypothetical protein [Klebsiella pneumoniae]MBX4703663.1 hypothetical protein [Klebsiella pneumoniae]MCD9656161.1 hypothetical protein [Klebsiella pneumoniae]